MANLSNINNKFLVTTGGNVLIGQTGAIGSSILQVTGNSTFAGNIIVGDGHFIGDDDFDNLLLQAGGTSNLENLVLSASNDLIFYTGGTTPSALGTERLRIYNSDGRATFSGNVTLSNGKMQISGPALTDNYLKINVANVPLQNGVLINYAGASQSTGLFINQPNGGGSAAADYALLKVNNQGANPTFYSSNNGSTPVIIKANGNVGIGTVSPTEKLSVSGNIELDDMPANGTRYLMTNETNTGTGRINIQAGGGSAAYGGGLSLIANSHASKPGWVIAGISSGAGTVGGATEGRFVVNTHGLGTGTDIFTVLRTGNVGIGTTSPFTNLEIEGSGLDSIIRLYAASGAANIRTWEIRAIGVAGEGLLFRQVNDANNSYTNRMIIDTDGDVGIGTITPAAKLEVVGDVTKTVSINQTRTDTSTSLATMRSFYAFGITQFRGGVDKGLYMSNITNNIPGIQVVDSSNNAGSLSIQPYGGNVGIGNTAPASKLHTGAIVEGSFLPYLNGTAISFTTSTNVITVHDSAALGTNTAAGLMLVNNNNSNNAPSPLIAFSARSTSNTYNQTYAAIWGEKNSTGADVNWNTGGLIFATSTSTGPYERMRINPVGDIGIGTNIPQAKFHINGGAIISSTRFGDNATASINTTGYIVATIPASSNGQSAVVEFIATGGAGAYYNVVYTCYNGAGVWYYTKNVVGSGGSIEVAETNGSGSSTLVFYFRATSGVQGYTPRVMMKGTPYALVTF